MPALDSNVPHKWYGDGAITITDGSGNTVTAGVQFFQDCTWSETAAPYTEAKNRGKRPSVPVAMKTGDGQCEVTMSFLVTSLKGNSTVHPYEAITRTGAASAWTSVIDGDKYAVQIDVTYNSSAGSVGGTGGGTQTVRHPYCIPTSVDPNHQDGLLAVEASFDGLYGSPTIL